MRLTDLIPILQIAVGPVILISGVGMLLLTLTNRFGRVIDRSRALADAVRKTPPAETTRLTAQLAILSRRARLVRLSITFATWSMLLAALLIISLFLAVLLGIELGPFVTAMFIGCLSCLIASLVIGVKDINVSLTALQRETGEKSDA